MKPLVQPGPINACLFAALLSALLLSGASLHAQSCPPAVTTTINSFPNTYYPGTTALASAGSTSITLGPATYGTTPISASDIVLIIQMQGAQIFSNNNANYGSGGGVGRGYRNNASLLAGKMEYAVATNAVGVGGGTLTLQSGLTNSYQNAVFGTDGQYRYQVIRVPVYYNITLTSTVTAPAWNGTTGGVILLCAINVLNMNGQTVNATGRGFRGGGGLRHSNPNNGGTATDYRALSTTNHCGTKGEGIAGTPRYLFASGSATLLDLGAALEGYPNGCRQRGAPGNAGGGATDGNPNSNSNNAGGGGGGNGAIGGGGGRSWSSQLFSGGLGGAAFAEVSPTRLVMGGGGGAGSTDGGTGTPNNGFASSGAPGGGIVIVRAGSITGTGTITANGAAPNTTLLNDGGGGGGAGGSVLIVAGSGLAGVTVNANGSNGASNTGAGSPHGPGGGGSGGVVYSTAALNASSSVTGGAAGTTQGIAPATFGATGGNAGILQVVAAPAFPLSCAILASTSSPVPVLAAVSHNKRLTVTPNPIDTDASVQFFAARSTAFTVRLVSLQGNTVFTMQYQARKGMNSIYLHDLRALPGGIYVLKLEDGTNCESTKLVIRH